MSSKFRSDGVFLLCLFAALAFLLVPSTYAKVTVKPSLGLSTGYTTNIDFKSGGTKSSRVIRVEPGISLMVPLKKAYFQTDYRYGYVNLQDGENTGTHQVRGLLRYNFSPLTSIGVSRSFQKSEIAFPGTATYKLNTTSVSLKKQFGSRLITSFGYSKEDYNDPSSDLFSDYKNNMSSLGIDYRFSSKFTGTLGFSTGNKDFGKTGLKDYDVRNYSIGLRRRVGSKLTISGNVGHTSRDYESGSDFDSYTYGLGLKQVTGKRSTLDISYAHTVEDTFYSQPTPESLYARNISILSNIDRYYKYMTVQRLGGTWIYNLSEKNSLSFGAAYQTSKANTKASLYNIGQTATLKKLSEDEYTLGVGYTRRFTKYFATTLKYVYGSRDSNVRGNYDYNFVSLDMNLSF